MAFIFSINNETFLHAFVCLQIRFDNRSDDDDLNEQRSAMSQKPILTLYTKNPCPLCDELVSELTPFMDRLHLEKVDITKPENQKYYRQYKYDIPVLHINGEFLCMHRLDAELLDTKLNEIQNLSG